MSAAVAAPEGMDSGSLVYPNERRLFGVALAISVLLWVALIVGTFGIALIYLLLAFVFYLFVQSAFISYLRGHAARFTEGQFPDLYDRIRGACMKLGVDPVPDAICCTATARSTPSPRAFSGAISSSCCRTWWTRWSPSPTRSASTSGTSWGTCSASTCCGARCCSPPASCRCSGRRIRARASTPATCTGSRAAARRRRRRKGARRARRGRPALEDDGCVQVRDPGRGIGQLLDVLFHELTWSDPWLAKRMARIVGGGQVRIPRRNFSAWVLAAFVPHFPVARAAPRCW